MLDVGMVLIEVLFIVLKKVTTKVDVVEVLVLVVVVVDVVVLNTVVVVVDVVVLLVIVLRELNDEVPEMTLTSVTLREVDVIFDMSVVEAVGTTE